jgi:hypothetical protein
LAEKIEDVLLGNSRREAWIVLLAWLGSLIYTVSVCYLFGYLTHEPSGTSVGPDVASLLGPLTSFNRNPESLTTPLGLGIPDWVFYGIVLPWVACIALTLWFCFRYFSEDDLGSADD